jgi:hypothetical protein
MKRLLLVLATLLCLSLPAAASAAFNPLGDACGSGGQASSSSVCPVSGSQNPIAGPNGALKKISLIIATIAGIAAVIIIVVAGFQFVIAAGDAQKVASARSALLGAIVGLVIISAAESIILFVVSKL